MKNAMKILMLSMMFTFIGQNLFAVSVNDEKPKSEVAIYPNPASNYLRINYSSTNDYNIVISNILGSVVYTSPVVSSFENSTFINLNDLKILNGIYLVKVYESTNLIATQKLIVRK
jgi:hypothetical protein